MLHTCIDLNDSTSVLSYTEFKSFLVITPQLAGEARQLGVLRLFWIMCVFYIIYLNYIYVCAHHNA